MEIRRELTVSRRIRLFCMLSLLALEVPIATACNLCSSGMEDPALQSKEVAGNGAMTSWEEADRVFTNGKVYTANKNQPWVEAVAMKGGKILAVGETKNIARHIGIKTERVDLQGRFMMPGIHDSHIHTVVAASNKFQVDFRHDSKKWVDIFREIETYATSNPEKKWIYGGHLPWLGEKMEDAAGVGIVPHRSILDRVVANRPVALYDFSLHSMLVNSKALEVVGITRGTPDPDGGTIERDVDGEPTGILRESAMNLVRESVDQPNVDDLAKTLPGILRQLNSLGITSINEAWLSSEGMKAFKRLDNEARLTLRVNGSVAHPSSYDSPKQRLLAEDIASARKKYSGKRINFHYVKMFLDGAGYDSLMVDPYPDPPKGKDPHGKFSMPRDHFQSEVIRYHGMGVGTVTHVSGDMAVRITLDAIEEARRVHGNTGARHVLAHCTIINPDDRDRIKRLGVIAEFSPYFWWPIQPGVKTRFNSRIGKERTGWVWAVKEMVKRGAHVAAGSDMPVVSDPNPFRAMVGLVTRKHPDGKFPDEDFNLEQGITLEQAVEMFTMGGAYYLQQEHMAGSIEAGKYADLIVLDRNLFAVPIKDVSQTQVLQTWLEGQLIYEKVGR